MNIESKFIEIKYSNNIWAIGSIHSHFDSFESIKKHILKNFKERDRLVFLGNIIGVGDQSTETLSQVIELRNYLLSKFYLKSEDIVFLRGSQEEMFLKLLQLQTAPNPYDIVKWIFDHGVNHTTESYGFKKDDILEVSTQNPIFINRWTTKLNKTILKYAGHKEYFSNLRHAAYSDNKKILFVNRGVDVKRPLSAQNDCFWWGYQNFSKWNQPYLTFTRIVRGYEHSIKNNNNIKNDVLCSLFKPPLNNNKIIGGLFDKNGRILDLFESK